MLQPVYRQDIFVGVDSYQTYFSFQYLTVHLLSITVCRYFYGKDRSNWLFAQAPQFSAVFSRPLARPSVVGLRPRLLYTTLFSRCPLFYLED